jgi:anti-sigma-K factor RskA
MNEFEYLRQMRSLRTPEAPSRDLWAAIDQRLDQTPATRSRHQWTRRLAVAAAIFGVAIFSGSIALRLAAPSESTSAASSTRWKPDDPRLAGAAVELSAAHSELTQAMHDAPDSPALRRILDRTQRQQERLRQLDRQAG